MLDALAEDLRDRGKIDLTEAFIDGIHAGAKRAPSPKLLAVALQHRSRQSLTLAVFQSRVVRAMRLHSSRRRDRHAAIHRGTRRAAAAPRRGHAGGRTQAARRSSRRRLAALSRRFIRGRLLRLIGDKAYGSKLDAAMKKRGIDMISPNHSTRTLQNQDGRKLRRYKRRWLVERAFA